MWKRWIIFLCIGIAVLGAQIAPFFAEGKCHIPAWADNTWLKEWVSPRDFIMGRDRKSSVPRVGSFYVVAYAVDPRGRLDAGMQLHRWARRYALAVILQAVSSLTQPWVFAICAPGTDTILGAFLACKAAAYISSQVILTRVTLVRLQAVASSGAATWAARSFKATSLAGALFCVTYGLSFSSALPKGLMMFFLCGPPR